MIEKTNYGFKKKGRSRFVIIAPHAAGDDLKTKELSQMIAEKLNASLVVNTNFRKRVEDFNKLSWYKGEYRWIRRLEEMKEFYDDTIDFVEPTRSFTDKPVVAYIHGMRDGKDKIGIDIGFGVKPHRGKLKGTRGKNKHPEAKGNTGFVRANRRHMKNLQALLEKALRMNYNLRAGIGEAKRYDNKGRKIQFAAWSRTNGIQYHAGRKEYSFQLEITRSLRRSRNLKNISKIIAEVLKSVYD